MRLLKSVMLSALLIAVGFSSAVVGQGDQQWVESTGMYAIINNDVGAARDRALDDARRKAVEMVVGVMVDSETLVENFQLVSDRIYTQSAGYICGEQIVQEWQSSGTYYVKLKACVAQGNLEDNLLAIGICLKRLGNPRTMIMLAEQNVGEKLHGWWEGSDLSIVETKIMEAFNNKGFPLLDPTVASGNIRVSKAIRGEPDPNDAVQVGKAYDAEYVIIGKAVATCKPKDQYNFYNCYANITARIVKVDNGTIFGTATGSGKMAHIEEHESGVRALQKAANQVAPALIKKITERCEKETGGGNEITVEVSNVTSLTKLRNFMSACEQIRGVNGVTRRKYGSGRAVLEILYKGRAGDLAEEIENATGATVTDFTANTIKLKLK